MDEQVQDTKVEEKATDTPTYTETEKQAMEQGWVPKDQWKGAEDDWTPAKAFMKYGDVESKFKKAQAEASQKDKVIHAMKDYYLNVKEDAKKELLDTFRRRKAEAKKNEDFEEVAKLDTQIDELSSNLERKFQDTDKKMEEVQNTAPPIHPEFIDWNRKNTWYDPQEDPEIVQEADDLGLLYANRNPKAQYKDVLNYVEKRIKQLHPDKFQPAREPVQDVNEGGERSGDSNTKSRVKLDAAQKAAAEAFGMTYEEYAKGMKDWDKQKGVA